MPLVEAICTSCGGTLRVDNSKEAAVCPYCKKAYIVQDAINNYVTHTVVNNVTNIENLHADNVILSDDRAVDSRVKAGDTFIRLGDYASANRVFSILSEECPYDYRGWWGLIRSNTSDLQDTSISWDQLQVMRKYYDNAVAVMGDGGIITGKYTSFDTKVVDKLFSVSEELNHSIDVANEMYADGLKKYEALKDDIQLLEFRLKKEEARLAEAKKQKQTVKEKETNVESIFSVFGIITGIVLGIITGMSARHNKIMLGIVASIIFGCIGHFVSSLLAIPFYLSLGSKGARIESKTDEVEKRIIEISADLSEKRLQYEAGVNDVLKKYNSEMQNIKLRDTQGVLDKEIQYLQKNP